MYLNGKKVRSVYFNGEKFSNDLIGKRINDFDPNDIKIPLYEIYTGDFQGAKEGENIFFVKNDEYISERPGVTPTGNMAVIISEILYENEEFVGFIGLNGLDLEGNTGLLVGWCKKKDIAPYIGGVVNPTIYFYLPALEVA